MVVAFRLLLLVGALVGACARDPAECPEPCLAGQRCYYGACIPIHDAGEDDGDAAD